MDRTKLNHGSESGVTILEVMIAAMILTIALMSVAMTMIQGMSAMYLTQERLVAKQKARETLESVFTARSTQNITFNQIRNNTVTGGIFLSGFQSVRGMGADGIANTVDDAATAIESIVFPGPDGALGTGDDETRTLNNYERQIVFSDVLLQSGAVDDDIRKVTIDVRFQVQGVWWTVSVSSLISRFA